MQIKSLVFLAVAVSFGLVACSNKTDADVNAMENNQQQQLTVDQGNQQNQQQAADYTSAQPVDNIASSVPTQASTQETGLPQNNIDQQTVGTEKNTIPPATLSTAAPDTNQPATEENK